MQLHLVQKQFINIYKHFYIDIFLINKERRLKTCMLLKDITLTTYVKIVKITGRVFVKVYHVVYIVILPERYNFYNPCRNS